MGYVIFGFVIVVGVLILVGNFDNWLVDWWENMWGVKIGFLLSGIIVILVYVYLVRFLVVVLGFLEGSLGKIKFILDDVVCSLGKSFS